MSGEELDEIVARCRRTLCAVAPVLPRRDQLGQQLEDAAKAAGRGYFEPDEDERVRGTFVRYLGCRAALHETIAELAPLLGGAKLESEEQRLRVFAVAFCAACMLVRSARYMVDSFSPHQVVWKKLDESEPRYGIPRKQFTTIYRSLTRPYTLWRFHQAIRFWETHREELHALEADPGMAEVLALLRDEEDGIEIMNRRAVASSRLRFRIHSWKRRQASTAQQILFALFEMSGRAIAEMRNPLHTKRVDRTVVDQVQGLLQPGDIFITRHDDAMSNLFLPGFWPHGALYLGTAEQRASLGIEIDEERRHRCHEGIQVLEARKDGVRFRPIAETLEVDAFSILRPQLDADARRVGLSRAVTHEGKLYDFEFDFRRADRLVCTEVIYRAYHAPEMLAFELQERAGRPTLSAEDLITRGIEGDGFDVVASYGVEGNVLVEGAEAREVLMALRAD